MPAWLSPVLFALSCVVAGCATGGGGGGTDAGRGMPRTDAGPGRTDAGRSDSGVVALDASMPPLDASMPPLDASMPPLDASMPPLDAGAAIDAGARDAGSTGCTSAAMCSDGLTCNGIERCEAGRCVAGTPIVCDDGVACTVDRCGEPGTCGYTGMDSLCAAGQTCGPTGCVGGGGTCTESPCRLTSPQCGCAAGQGCYLAAGARVCATSGAGGEGTACTSSSSCQVGLDCINYSLDPAVRLAQCGRFCSTDANCSGGGSLCLGELSDGAGGTLPGVRLCTRSCNAFRNTGCATGLSCQIYREAGGSMRFLTECAGPSGTGRTDAPCIDNTDCAGGYACFGAAGGVGSCLHWCNLGTGIGCSGLELCEALVTPVLIGGVSYGVCTPF